MKVNTIGKKLYEIDYSQKLVFTKKTIVKNESV